MLTGPPGSGKSTLVGRLAGMGVRPAAVHLCRRSVVQSTEPLPALASFAAALAGAVPGYAEAVIRRQPSAWRSAAAKANADAATQARLAVLDSADAYAAYEHAFRDPLSALAAAGELGRGVVVVIDGLDEAGPRGNELTDLISAAVRRPIPCFRLLMTTRPGPIADRLPAAPSLDLADDPSTVDTIASALESTSLGRGTRLTIAKAAQGNFLLKGFFNKKKKAEKAKQDSIKKAQEKAKKQ